MNHVQSGLLCCLWDSIPSSLRNNGSLVLNLLDSQKAREEAAKKAEEKEKKGSRTAAREQPAAQNA